MHRVWFLTTLMTSLAIQGQAQSVRGRVVLPDSVTPLANATILARDDSGTTIGRAVSATDGRYVVLLPHPGTFELQVVRIGYRPVRMHVATLTAGEQRMVDIVMTQWPVELATVEVMVSDRCRMRAQDRDVFLELWQQARAALGRHVFDRTGSVHLRVFVVEGVEDGPVTLPSGLRFWDPNNRDPELDSLKARDIYTDQGFGTTPPEVLLDGGYVRRRADGRIAFDAPTPEAVLSDRFLASHCFGIERGLRTQPDWIGVSFRPIAERDSLTDIAGTLWLHQPTGELRRLDFNYTNLQQLPERACVLNAPEIQRAGELRGPRCFRPQKVEGTGGTLDFAYLEQGEWFVNQWTIRTPGDDYMDRYSGFNLRSEGGALVRCYDRPPACMRFYVAVPRLHVTSGAVASLLRDGVDLYRNEATLGALSRIAARQAGRAHAHLTGVVTDTAGRPVAGATVSTDSPVRAALSDSSGHFEIRMLPATPIAVRVRRAGYHPIGFRLALVDGSTHRVEVVLAAIEEAPGRW